MWRALLLLVALAAPAWAEGGRRVLTPLEASAFRAVGRLNMAGSRFCTATLISDRLAVTAAHCLYSPRTGRRVPVRLFRFVAGLGVGGVHVALREVVRATPSPGFVYGPKPKPASIGQDVALLELAAPVPAEQAEPFPVDAALGRGEAGTIVSYARDRAQAPSIEAPCRVIERAGDVAALGCTAQFGASGAPVFALRAGGYRLVGVVSAMGDMRGLPVALTVAVAPRLGAIEAAGPGEARP